jgi:ubiquinone/menaquinone biosynthesis C-methylase UbiE
MTADHYARSGRRWAQGAELVYRPIAAELVALSPHRLAGRTVLDAGAGTGAVSSALGAQGARALATDLSAGMLAWNAATRPPSAVADIRALPLANNSVDDAIAAFVLNHLTDPVSGLAELARVTRPGGAVLAAVFSNDSGSQTRDRIDATAAAAGWQVPGWYAELKTTATPILGSRAGMASAAHQAGLAEVSTEERPVDVGVTEAAQLVRYRLGHPIFAGWLDAIGAARAEALAAGAEQAIRDDMQPYRPIVVFLSAITPLDAPRSWSHTSDRGRGRKVHPLIGSGPCPTCPGQPARRWNRESATWSWPPICRSSGSPPRSASSTESRRSASSWPPQTA